MLRKTLAVFMIAALTMALVPVTSHAIIPVAVDADIPSIIHWAQRFQAWAQREAVVIHTYHEIILKYQWAKKVATTIKNGDALTLLAVITGVASQNLTRIDNFQDLRKMLEGTETMTNSMSSMYHSIYGQALAIGHISPAGAEDWTTTAARTVNMTQQADAAILETYAVAANTNRYSHDNQSKYNLLMDNIKSPGVMPEQTAQHQAIASVYTAQAIERNNQLLASLAIMQAQKMAQDEAYLKKVTQENQRESDYIEGIANYMRTHPYYPDPWNHGQ